MAKNIYGFEAPKRFKAVSVIEVIVVAVLAVAVIAMLSFFFLYSKDGTARKFFGSYVYLSDVTSMDPAIPVGSAVFADPDAVEALTPGKAVLCNVDYNNETFTTILRIQDIQPEAGETYYILRGDSNAENETIRLPKSQILAECVSYSTFFGAILTFSTSQLGILTGIIVPCLLVIVIQVLRIIRVNKYDSMEDEDEYDDEDFNTDDVVFSTLRHEQPAPEPVQPPEPQAKKLYIGNEGKAEYVKKTAPTADREELHETMRSNARTQTPMRTPTAASINLNAQRSTVNDHFRQKPTARASELPAEYFERPSKNSPVDSLYELSLIHI